MLFNDRLDAGEKLAEKIKDKIDVVLAIPKGGIPVGYSISKKLKVKLGLIFVRKLPIPWDPEAGFGAVTFDGKLSLNKNLVNRLGLRKEDIDKIKQEVIREIKRREKILKFKKIELRNKNVLIVDDGLASGYTMLAAIKSVKHKKPKKIIIAVPVASSEAYELIKRKIKNVICLHISKESIFAVASFYKNWSEISDKEALKFLNQ